MRPRITALALFLLTLLAYSNSFQAGFVLDNKPLILSDPRVHAATTENLQRILDRSYWWPIGEAGIYRPFTKLTYLFNYAVLGNQDRPAGYHVVNFLLHFGNVLLVYLLGLRLTRDWGLAVALAGLWAVHPVLTESVTNIVGRADLLAAAAVVGGLLLYLKVAEARGARRLAWLAGLAATALVGMFSKESAAVLLGIVVLHELTWWKERRNAWALLLGCAAIALPFLAMWAQRSAVLAAAGHYEFPFTDNPITGADFPTGRLTAVGVMARSLGLIAWPARLSSDYSYRQIPLATGKLEDWIAWLAVAATAAAVAVLFRRNRTAFFFACFAFFTYLPASNLLFPAGTIMAERFLYLPSIGVMGCVVLAGHAVARRHSALRWAAVAVGVAAVCLAARTWVRNLDWRDELSIARSAASASPNSYKSHKALALALYEADAVHSQLDAAIAEIERSVAILDPLPDEVNNADTYMVAGGFLVQKGDRLRHGTSPAAAEASYRRALAVLKRGDQIVRTTNRLEEERAHGNPALMGPPTRFAPLYRLLAAAYLRLNENEQSLTNALYARELASTDAESYKQLAFSYWSVHDSERAAITLMEGTMLTSDSSLKDAVIDLYRSGLDDEGCAVVNRNGVLSLNPICPMVRRHLCAAAANAIQRHIQTGHPDLAENLKLTATGQFGCDASSISGQRK